MCLGYSSACEVQLILFSYATNMLPPQGSGNMQATYRKRKHVQKIPFDTTAHDIIYDFFPGHSFMYFLTMYNLGKPIKSLWYFHVELF